MILSCADVHICDINSMTFRVNANRDSYRLTRKILVSLKEQCGLPLHLHSEEVAEMSTSIKRRNGDNTVSKDIIFEEGLPPRYENIFLVTGHKLVGKNRERLIFLAKEVGQKLEFFGLSVVVHQ